MPEYALWTLVVSLAIYSFGVTLQAAFFFHRLKLVDKEVDGLIKQVKSIEQEHKDAIMSLSKLKETEKQELIESFENSIKEIVHLFSKQQPENAIRDALIRQKKYIT